MSDLSSTDKCKRALRIRELAGGYDDKTSRSMLALAEELEKQDAQEQANKKAQPPA